MRNTHTTLTETCYIGGVEETTGMRRGRREQLENHRKPTPINLEKNHTVTGGKAPLNLDGNRSHCYCHRLLMRFIAHSKLNHS